MPDDNPLTSDQRLRVLEAGHRVLTEQLAEVAVRLQEVSQCLQLGEARMGNIETELRANSATTVEVREILSTAKAGFKVLGGIGTLVRWAGYLAAAGATIYTAWHMLTHGGKPPGAT